MPTRFETAYRIAKADRDECDRRVLSFIYGNPDCFAAQVGRCAWSGNEAQPRIPGLSASAGPIQRLRDRGLIKGTSGSYRITVAGRATVDE